MADRKRKTVKTSIGVTCCRLGDNGYEILLVKKRYSYYFMDFVQGKYKSSDAEEILKLLNGMTYEEKMIISSLNFSYIWYMLWLNEPPKWGKYFICKNKFESSFVSDGGDKIRKLIQLSYSIDNIWEIPKGRREKGETDICCAIREFREETSMTKASYIIMPNILLNHNYYSDNVFYKNKYYVAITNNDKKKDIKIDLLSKIQMIEVSAVRWFSMKDLQNLYGSSRITPVFRKAINILKKYNKFV